MKFNECYTLCSPDRVHMSMSLCHTFVGKCRICPTFVDRLSWKFLTSHPCVTRNGRLSFCAARMVKLGGSIRWRPRRTRCKKSWTKALTLMVRKYFCKTKTSLHLDLASLLKSWVDSMTPRLQRRQREVSVHDELIPLFFKSLQN